MYLPKRTTDKQKDLYVDSGRLKLYLISATSTAILVAGMFLFVKTNPFFVPYTVFSIATIIYLTFTYVIGIFGKDFDYEKHKRITLAWTDVSANEEIDILLPICGEPIEIILNTWKHVAKLALAHEGKIKVWVLDDKKDIKIAALAEKFQFNYIARPTNELKKAGNLRYAFSRTKAPYFIIFDADFAPRQDFIQNTMPYFYEDKKVGIVQTPQFFEIVPELTKVQRGAASVQELFYRLIQVSRDSFDGAICVGSNAVYSRSHLDKFGGTAPIGYSEDVRTGVRLTMTGEKVRYIPLNLAMGTCPETWKSFFTQYYRWSMGSLDLMLSREFWTNKLSFMQYICYLSGMMYYLTTGLSVIFASVPSIYLLLYKPEYIFWFNLIFALPSVILSVFYMKIWQKLPYDLDVLRVRQVSFYAHIYALKDILCNTLEEWKPTGANTSSKRYDSFCVFYTFMTLAVPIVTIGLIMTRIEQGYDWHNFALLFALTIFNAYIAIPVIDDL